MMPRQKGDPLLQAVIKKLPPPHAEWHDDQQLAWLKMMAMAFGTVYGGNVLSMLANELAPRQALTPFKPMVVKQYPYYIDKDNMVRGPGDKPIMPKDVKGTLYDLRGLDGDVKNITWADGSTGIAGIGQLTISAA